MSTEPAEPLKITPLALTQRFSSEGRWHEIQPVRDLMMRECRQKGMSKEEAHEWTYAELNRMYPPLEKPAPTIEEVMPRPVPEVVVGEGDSDTAVDGGESPESQDYARAREGLGRLPRSWPALADNAQLPVELGWVQANRLRVVEERPHGEPIIRLKRAGSPAPSWAALGWLDTAIRNPAKWADICARGMAQQELESDITKRERRSIEDVRTLLGEMHAQLG